MLQIKFSDGDLTASQQAIISNGFERHTSLHAAPKYEKKRLNWLAYNAENVLVGALTADLLWDWIYVDELWLDEGMRGHGYGKDLMKQVEEFAASKDVQGIWLWTQSWQAAEFYQNLDYREFAHFPDFPKGHSRIGFRKLISKKAV